MDEEDLPYIRFFLDRRRSVYEIETVELSHPSFSKTYYLLHRHRRPMTLTLENGQAVTFEYVPMRLTPLGASGDLDYGVQVVLGDLGEIIPDEVDRIQAAGTMRIRPVAKFRSWRSDDLTKPMILPVKLEVGDLSRNREGATFNAMAPRLNLVRTGEIYKVERFPMLTGFL
ncbi:DUF1833 family protein [Alcaligenaceae bacterium B3P038]|nr:DUF1833 family protein [Alcaligenaceae bacterium B3P038]